MPYFGCRRQASAALDSRSDLQSPHAPSPTTTAKQSQFNEDRGAVPSVRSSLDSPTEHPSNSPSSASGTLTKAADQQRHQPAQVWKCLITTVHAVPLYMLHLRYWMLVPSAPFW